eukprot:Filipodium_phascolosomae@DN6787_c0_g1_i1.p1
MVVMKLPLRIRPLSLPQKQSQKSGIKRKKLPPTKAHLAAQLGLSERGNQVKIGTLEIGVALVEAITGLKNVIVIEEIEGAIEEVIEMGTGTEAALTEVEEEGTTSTAIVMMITSGVVSAAGDVEIGIERDITTVEGQDHQGAIPTIAAEISIVTAADILREITKTAILSDVPTTATNICTLEKM